jgi:cytolysin (calcineurin-like family phosphatase)
MKKSLFKNLKRSTAFFAPQVPDATYEKKETIL